MRTIISATRASSRSFVGLLSCINACGTGACDIEIATGRTSILDLNSLKSLPGRKTQRGEGSSASVSCENDRCSVGASPAKQWGNAYNQLSRPALEYCSDPVVASIHSEGIGADIDAVSRSSR
jgi:hypothetical protein